MNDLQKSQVLKETFLLSPRLVLTVFYFDTPTLTTPSQSWYLGGRFMLLMDMDIPQSAQHLLPPLCHTVSPILPEHGSSINRAFLSFLIFIQFLISLIQSNSNSDEFQFAV